MKIVQGVYEYTFGELKYRVSQLRDGDPGTHVNGKWVFDGGANNSEGGHDLYETKREAVAALNEYVKHRKYVKPYGWCYVPDESLRMGTV